MQNISDNIIFENSLKIKNNVFVLCYLFYMYPLFVLSNLTQQISRNPSPKNNPHVCYDDPTIINDPSERDTMGRRDHERRK